MCLGFLMHLKVESGGAKLGALRWRCRVGFDYKRYSIWEISNQHCLIPLEQIPSLVLYSLVRFGVCFRNVARRSTDLEPRFHHHICLLSLVRLDEYFHVRGNWKQLERVSTCSALLVSFTPVFDTYGSGSPSVVLVFGYFLQS